MNMSGRWPSKVSVKGLSYRITSIPPKKNWLKKLVILN